MEQWYTLHTKPHAEYRVAAALQSRGIETYLPEIEEQNAPPDQKKCPFFPNYLFCRIDLETTPMSVTRYTPGMRRLVAFDGQPVPVPNEVIAFIKRRVEEIEAAGDKPIHDFKPGDKVRITDGPFRDFEAIFEGPSTPTRRVQVLLDILGRASRAYIDVADLDKAPSCSEKPERKRSRRTRGRGRSIDHG